VGQETIFGIKEGDKKMRRKTIVGVIAIVAIVAAVILTGCVDIPQTSFKIEYPVTAYFEDEDDSYQITLYEDGTLLASIDGDAQKGEWEIREKTSSRKKYELYGAEVYLELYSNHDALIYAEGTSPHEEGAPREAGVMIKGYWK